MGGSVPFEEALAATPSLFNPSLSQVQNFLQQKPPRYSSLSNCLYEFLNTFSVKCAYLLFNKEHVKAILLEIVAQNSAGNAQHTQSCMNILVIIARFCPLLLSGSEEEQVNLLKDNNDIIKEGVLNVLAKAGVR